MDTNEKPWRSLRSGNEPLCFSLEVEEIVVTDLIICLAGVAFGGLISVFYALSLNSALLRKAERPFY